jgi:hypothetical protein
MGIFNSCSALGGDNCVERHGIRCLPMPVISNGESTPVIALNVTSVSVERPAAVLIAVNL